MQVISMAGVTFVFSAVSLLAEQQPTAQSSMPAHLPLANHAEHLQTFPNVAQTITEQELKRHPDVLVMAFHAQIPGESINRVVAINQAQWGNFLWRPSDEIDTDTAKSQRTVVQVIPATHRMEVHMPLRTRAGATIATFVCVWNSKNEEEAPDLMRKSQSIRDEIATQITDISQLLGKP